MKTLVSASDPNLTELRCQLARRVSLILVAVSAMSIWLALLPDRFPFVEAGLLAGLAGLGLLVRLIGARNLRLAPALLVIGLTLWLLVAITLVAELWVPFVALPLSVVCALLVSGGGFAVAGPVAALALWFGLSGARGYALPQFVSLLALSAVLGWLVMRTLYTALEWAWTMQERADDLLEQTRDRQGELARARSIRWTRRTGFCGELSASWFSPGGRQTRHGG